MATTCRTAWRLSKTQVRWSSALWRARAVGGGRCVADLRRRTAGLLITFKLESNVESTVGLLAHGGKRYVKSRVRLWQMGWP